jgi:hypothetical protein
LMPWSSAFSAALIAGCSVLVDADDIDQGCGAGQKLCGQGHCVRIDDPAYGCQPSGCQPCLLDNAIPECRADECAVKSCLDGFGCPVDRLGCNVNLLVDRNNCGSCGAPCTGGERCAAGQCVAE